MRRNFLIFLSWAVCLSVLNSGEVACAKEPAPIIVDALYNLTGYQTGLDVPSSQKEHTSQRMRSAKKDFCTDEAFV